MANLELAEAACKFIDECPTPFHLCHEVKRELKTAGFVELKEADAWRPLLKPGGSYYYVRNGTTLVAFTIGGGYESGNGFSIIG